MDTDSLKLFLHLSKTLHFGKTSEALHMSPSTLSRAIQRLEEEIGCKLFYRDNRSVTLTAVGNSFQTYAQEALDHWSRFENSLLKKPEDLQGEIRLYCSVTASYRILSGILSLFREKYPGIEINLRTGDPEKAIPNVINGEEDIVIAAKPDRLSDNVSFQTVILSPLLFIAPVIPCAVSDQLKEKTIGWDTIPMILSETGPGRKRVDRWFREKGVKPNIYAQISGNEAIVSMVALGFGIGVVPELVLKSSPESKNIRVLDVYPSLEAYSVGICTLSKRLENPLVQAFWDTALEAFQIDR